ncbi:phage holin family protein [Geomonas silvestris]|nr:phage holin family protein [Geomonas silvestris]
MPEREQKTIGALFTELTREVRTLFRQELELFLAEMKAKVTDIAKDTLAVGLGAALLYFGAFALIAAIVLGLATVMPAWGAALLVAVAFLGTGVVLVQRGLKNFAQLDKKPEETVATLKETVQWAKTLRNSSRRRTRFANKYDTRKAI